MTKLNRALHGMTDGKTEANLGDEPASEYDLSNHNEDAILEKVFICLIVGFESEFYFFWLARLVDCWWFNTVFQPWCAVASACILPNSISVQAANYFLEWLGGIYDNLSLICLPDNPLHQALTSVLTTIHDHRSFTKYILHRIWSSCCCSDVSLWICSSLVLL